MPTRIVTSEGGPILKLPIPPVGLGIWFLPLGSIVRPPSFFSAKRTIVAAKSLVPLTRMPVVKPPITVIEEMLFETCIPAACNAREIWRARTVDSASIAYEVISTETLRKCAQLLVTSLAWSEVMRLGAICASSFRRSIFSASAALVASAALSVAFAASALAAATRAWACADASFARAMSSRNPSDLALASDACCSARAILLSAFAARSCCFAAVSCSSATSFWESNAAVCNVATCPFRTKLLASNSLGRLCTSSATPA